MDEHVIVGAAIVRDGRLLIAQRSYPHDLAGRWELPGGRVEPAEAEADAVRRECVEELRAEVLVGGRLGQDVELPGGRLLRVYVATLADPAAEPVAVEHQALRWVDAAGLADVDWLPADRVLVPALRELVGSG